MSGTFRCSRPRFSEWEGACGMHESHVIVKEDVQVMKRWSGRRRWDLASGICDLGFCVLGSGIASARWHCAGDSVGRCTAVPPDAHP